MHGSAGSLFVIYNAVANSFFWGGDFAQQHIIWTQSLMHVALITVLYVTIAHYDINMHACPHTHTHTHTHTHKRTHTHRTGAFGYFEVTDDITKYCKAKVFSEIGKKTPIGVRFSTVGQLAHRSFCICAFTCMYFT